MPEPITRPKAAYSALPDEEKKVIEQLFETQFKHARIPSFARLGPVEAKKCALGLLDLGMLKVCRENGKAWLELHNGKGYIRV